jgi:alpha-L-fucosidase
MNKSGDQRLHIDKLKAWQKTGFGIFLHFGMSSYDGIEFSPGDTPIESYQPDQLDVDQWVRAIKASGARYAVLTAKHTAGFCLWPSSHTEYHVGNSPVQTDVIREFTRACERHGILPGLYYCLWDNHHRLGSATPSDIMEWKGISAADLSNGANPSDVLDPAYTTPGANHFFKRQITELLSNYGPLFEVWIDIPGIVGRIFREELYEHIALLQPEAVIMMNNGFGDGTKYPVEYAWPADIMSIERWLPNSAAPFNPWRSIEGRQIYLPAEVCDPAGREWFFKDGDDPRSDLELLGMFAVCRARGTNFLLNVPPDRSGRISPTYEAALQKLGENIKKLPPTW